MTTGSRIGPPAMALGLALVMAGCGNSDEDGPSLFEVATATPTTAFLPLEQYQYNDFDLAEDVMYWEVRANAPLSLETPIALTYELLYSYQRESMFDLFADDLDELAELESLEGFHNLCEPRFCPVYIAGVGLGAGLFLVTSKTALLTFLGELDTPAEVAFWLWTEGFLPLEYNIVDAGFEALVAEEDSCGGRQPYRVFVDGNGVVTITEALAFEPGSLC